MENKNALIALRPQNIQVVETDSLDVTVFDKNAVRRDLSDGLKQFGVGCCEVGKSTISPLVATLTNHLFDLV